MVEAQVQEPYELQGVTFHGPDSEPRWVPFTYSERLGSFGAEGGGSTPSEALDELLRVLRIDRR